MPRRPKGYERVKNRRYDKDAIGTYKTVYRTRQRIQTGQSAATQRDVNRIIKKLKKLPEEYRGKTLKKVLKKNAKPTIVAAKQNVNDAKKPVKRYSKVSSFSKTAKGEGKVVATYAPGNLRRSIGVFTRIRLKTSILVGPRVYKKKPNGTFKGNRVDGWYAHFVEYGTVHQKGIHFMQRAFDSTKDAVLRGIYGDVGKILKNWTAKNRIR